HELKKGPMIMKVPKDVRKKDDERRQPADPDPFVNERTSLGGQKQADNNTETKQCDGVFLLQSQPSKTSEPQPVMWLVAFDRENDKVCTRHPKVRLQAVSGEQVAVGKIHRGNPDTDRG